MSNEREQLIARLRRFAVVLEARGETYDAETCEQAIASLSAPVAEPPLYTIGRGSDGRATVTTTPAPDLIALVNQQAEDEAVRLLREARPDVDYALVNSSGKGRSARAALLAAIDAYLARVKK